MHHWFASLLLSRPGPGRCVPPCCSSAGMSVCVGSTGSAPQSVPVAPADHQTQLRDSVRPASSKFRGIRFTSVKAIDAPVLRAEIAVLLAKDAIEPVPPADMRSGFYSPYFIVPKKNGGLRPILHLRVLNRALHKLPFKILMQKRIFRCVHPLDWFAAIDLKDAYFHVSILPRHRPFLRFVFEGGHISTRSCPLGCPCRLVSSPKSRRRPLFP